MIVRLGIDAGGTFTDVLAIDENGTQTALKVPSTPASPTDGPIAGIQGMIDRLAIDRHDVVEVAHGTTVGLNALLQRRFPPVGLIVTRGFRHVLEIARHTVPGQWGSLYSWVKPPRVVPLEMVFEVDERVDADGSVRQPLDEASVKVAIAALRDAGTGTVAVCLIHAYANPDHERRIGEMLRAANPEWPISLSSAVMPEFREYERMVTTATNAVLTPLVGAYFAAFDRRVRETANPAARIYAMRSAGGVIRAIEASATPLRTALSGPAAGVLGMAHLAAEAGYPDAITFDMGGTSTDVAAIEGGEPALTTDATIDIYPLRTPTIDLVSIGAGGGSLAFIGSGGRLRVGPQSAGADPGPACYGKGSTTPTVTDANLHLGRIPASLVGGSFALDPKAAEAALAELGQSLGLSAEGTAYSLLEIAAHNMAGAIRQISIRRGRDPRGFALVAFGGAGPLHAFRLAEILSIPTILVPPYPGLGSCTGLLVADELVNASATIVQQQPLDAAAIATRFAAIHATIGGRLDGDPTIERFADLRYVGSGSELTVRLADGPVEDAVAGLVDAFHDQYERLFGYAYRGSHAVELLAIRVTGRAARQGTAPTMSLPAGAVEPAGERRALIDEANGWQSVPVYRREGLPVGWRSTGPFLVDQYDSTTVVAAGQQCRVDDRGNLVLTRE